MIFDLIVMIAVCIPYSLGMEMGFKFRDISAKTYKIDHIPYCEGKVTAWLELLIFYRCATSLFRLISVFIIQNHIISQLSLLRHQFYEDPRLLTSLNLFQTIFLLYLTWQGNLVYSETRTTCLVGHKLYFFTILLSLMLCYF